MHYLSARSLAPISPANIYRTRARPLIRRLSASSPPPPPPLLRTCVDAFSTEISERNRSSRLRVALAEIATEPLAAKVSTRSESRRMRASGWAAQRGRSIRRRRFPARLSWIFAAWNLLPSSSSSSKSIDAIPKQLVVQAIDCDGGGGDNSLRRQQWDFVAALWACFVVLAGSLRTFGRFREDTHTKCGFFLVQIASLGFGSEVSKCRAHTFARWRRRAHKRAPRRMLTESANRFLCAWEFAFSPSRLRLSFGVCIYLRFRLRLPLRRA